MHSFMIVVFVATAWSSVCSESGPADQFHYNESDTIYSIFKRLETIVTKDKEALYTMKEAFFPTLHPHFWESARVNVVKIRVCVITNETLMKCNSSGRNNSMFLKTQCWKYLWSSSPALTKITNGQLFAFDPVFAALIYSYFRGSRHRGAHILLPVNSAVFPCVPLESDFMQAVVQLLSWVSAKISFPG